MLTRFSRVTGVGGYRGLAVGVLALLLMTFLASVKLGAVPMSWVQVLAALLEPASADGAIVWQLRLPRAVLAVLLGGFLAASGVASQSLFRNPLADPSLIGVSAGASFGAALAIVLWHGGGHYWLGLSMVSLAAFAAATLTVWLVYTLASGPFGTSVATMLLAGLALAFLAGSVTSLLEYFADSQMLRQLSLWRMGGFAGADWLKCLIALLVGVPAMLTIGRHRRELDALLLGEAQAEYLGVDVRKVKFLLFTAMAAAVAVSVALVGTIAFVGLLVPHMARALVGPEHRRLLPLATCLGACLLLLADLLGRSLIAPVEVPAGLVVTLLGAPVFLYLLRNRYQFQA